MSEIVDFSPTMIGFQLPNCRRLYKWEILELSAMTITNDYPL